ncbi:MAG: hypothetical protein HRT72_04400, partial [Flavobacteriales bacterium]|nr:hypothetical protein [Flavobacteriales bacterium]
ALDQNDAVEFTASFSNMEFDVIFADFGPDYQFMDGFDLGKIGLFDQALGGELSLAEPEIKVGVTSSFGIDVSVDIGSIGYTYMAGETELSDELTFEGSNPLAPFVLAGPTNENFRESKKDSVQINYENSSIVELIASAPRSMEFNIGSVLANSSTAANPRVGNFVRSDSKIDIEVDVRLPLIGRAKGFNTRQRVEVDLGSELDGNANPVKTATIILDLENGFPWEVTLEAWFESEDSTRISTLVEKGVFLEGAEINSNGETTGIPGSKSTEFVAEVSKLDDAKFLVIDATIETSGNGDVDVQMLNNYKIGVTLGLIVELDANVNELTSGEEE